MEWRGCLHILLIMQDESHLVLVICQILNLGELLGLFLVLGQYHLSISPSHQSLFCCQLCCMSVVQISLSCIPLGKNFLTPPLLRYLSLLILPFCFLVLLLLQVSSAFFSYIRKTFYRFP